MNAEGPSRRLPSRRPVKRKPIAAVTADVQFGTSRRGVPHPATLRYWAEQAFAGASVPAVRKRNRSLTLRIVDAAESRSLNSRWRGKDKPTNVLSFPAGADLHDPGGAIPLGDIVVCASVVRREAREQAKQPLGHWAHMVVHGMLHLLGYDHENDRDADAMERLEATTLARLGFPDPYQMKDATQR
jgi:probable rRNA maturation factor